ncbi:hypothetical protein J2Y46_002613 [Microbacterium sp. BE35]|uniref:hypothetical protein n=1 Tax=Microbacterium sp. BE35 TaxID=2817773 RepID=UPI00285B1AFD|nr:hypothetical protein [Microbacterium sp. BE35]MDR7189787.1 hypothetical protein [Microbacterium sp. BE35]
MLLADNVPILRGSARWSLDRQIPDSVQITVPRFSVEGNRTVDWLPVSDSAPLARFGQMLDVTVVVNDVDTRLGRFLITEWAYDESSITVQGEGLLRIAADDRLPAVLSPRDGGTLQSEFLRLLPAQMSAQFVGLSNRSCPVSMQWEENRLDDLYLIADSWPARLRMDEWGQVLLKQPLADEVSSVVVAFTDGEGGTVVSVPRVESRDRAYNHVVARSSADGVDAWAEAVQTAGPMNAATYFRVTKFFSSPLLLNQAQCLAAAQTQLSDAVRPSRTVRVTAAPDPRIELDDPVEVMRDGFRDRGYVVAVELPLTVDDGPMTVDVGVF